MDLQLYARVLWRHNLLLAAGIALALALALLSVVRVNFVDGGPKFDYRQPNIWQATTRLGLTQRGFPQGRSRFPVAEGDPGAFDPGRLSELSTYYAQLANADEVQLKVLGRSSDVAALMAAPVIEPTTEEPAPFIDILGLGGTPLTAARISARGAEVFIGYVSERQAAARIPLNDRVLLQVVREPLGIQGPELAQGRKKTTPVFVFLAVLVATFGLIFVVENTGGRRGGPTPVHVDPEQEVPRPLPEQRKSASGRS